MPACPLADAEESWSVGSGSTIGPWSKISSDYDRSCVLGSLGPSYRWRICLSLRGVCCARVARGGAKSLRKSRMWLNWERDSRLYLLQTLAAMPASSGMEAVIPGGSCETPEAAILPKRKESTIQSRIPFVQGLLGMHLGGGRTWRTESFIWKRLSV